MDDNQAIEGLSQEQIDAILAIANAGVDDSENEDTGEPEPIQNGDSNGIETGPDNRESENIDMPEPLQQMITQLVAEHKHNSVSRQANGQNSTDPYAPVITSVSDPYGRARNSAAALSSLLSESGVPMNSIIPAIQGRMASQIRQQSNEDYRPRPITRRKVSAAYIESWGSPAEFNRRLLATPIAYSQPLNKTLASSQSSRPADTRNSRLSLNTEKIQYFGRPPPGGMINAESHNHA